MNIERLIKLVRENISDVKLIDLEETYGTIEEGICIVLEDKGVITKDEYEEIVNTEEFYTPLTIKLGEPNRVKAELTILEITDRDGWILDTKAYETNVFDIENPLHIEVNTSIQKALARGFKVRIYQEDK